MVRLEDAPKHLKGAGTLCLAEAWQRWRGDRLVPLKGAMELRDVRAFLPWLGLLELGDADTVRVRLAGSALLDVYGRDMTHRNLREITRPQDWPRRNARCRSLLHQPCGLVYDCVKPLAEDGKVAAYETLALPLDVDPAGTVRQILYCVARLPDEAAPGAGAGAAAGAGLRFAFIDIGCGVPDDADR
jgi:hypothetical protein